MSTRTVAKGDRFRCVSAASRGVRRVLEVDYAYRDAGRGARMVKCLVVESSCECGRAVDHDKVTTVAEVRLVPPVFYEQIAEVTRA